MFLGNSTLYCFANLTFLHLFQCKRSCWISCNLHKFDSAKASDSQCGQNSQVWQFNFSKLFIDPENANYKIVIHNT